jgi:capsid protein
MQTFDATAVIRNRPWFERALETIAPQAALRRLQARVETALFSYNAAQTNRLYAPMQYGQPSESSQTVRERVVMMWEARNLVENCPEVKEVSRKFGNYLTPTEYSPATGDRDYNATVNEWFHTWCKQADATGRNSFRKLVQLAAENRPVDGDCGFVIRRVGDGLKLQLVPATRIGNPNEMGLDSENYFEGVITNEFGVPVAYRIYRVTREGVYFGAEDVPAGNFCHYFDPFRVDQYRGVTDFHAAIQTARMLHEILQAEKAGVRFASQQAALVFTDRGTANSRNLFTPTPSAVLPSGQQQKNELSEVGMIKYLGQADRVETMPARPSTAFTGFIAHLMHELSIAVGIPKGVLFGTQDYAGPSVRAEFAAADRVFARHQGVLVDKVLDPIKNAVILDAIARGEIPAPPARDGETPVQALKRATRGEWRFPPKLTIDVGRESAANLNENRQGAKSLQEIASEQGTDAFTRLEQIAAEASFVKELSERYEIPETAIRLVTNSLPSTPAAAAATGDNVAAAAAEAQAESSGTESETPDQPATPAELARFAAVDLTPTDAMAAEAKRGLEWREKFNRGGTAVGVARARDISNKASLSPDTVRRMVSYFARHEVDKQGTGFSPGEDGYPSAGRIAWALWGGDAGASWARAKSEALKREELSRPTSVADALEAGRNRAKRPLERLADKATKLAAVREKLGQHAKSGAQIEQSLKKIGFEPAKPQVIEFKPEVSLSDARKMLAERTDSENKLDALVKSIADKRSRLKTS